MSQPNEIKLGGVELTDQSYEVARIWVTHEAGSSTWVDAGVLEDPKTFGYVMADAVRQAAFAYSMVWGIDQGEAAKAITAGLVEDLERQFETASAADGDSD